MRENDISVTGFFYNPNVHPISEYNARKQAMEEYNKTDKLEVIYPDYAPDEFFQEVEFNEDAPGRCSLCWGLRIQKTAAFAKKGGFDYFSTTLLVSPYQDQDSLKNIGNGIAEKEGINFYYDDFRAGFRQAHNEAHALGIYCQKYCGCRYSEMERCRQSQKR